MVDPLDQHYRKVLKYIKEGKVIPFFGAGVNLCDRPEGEPWKRGENLPNGSELAEHLAAEFDYPGPDTWDLLRVSQYAAIMDGSAELYAELRNVFIEECKPTSLHRFFATLPGALRARGLSPGYQLIVTTNYDDLMERAFEEAHEPFDVVGYVAEHKDHRGKFWHWPHNENPSLIEKPKEYMQVSTDKRCVILKIHGAIDRDNKERDSYMITEDHYIDYLTRTDISNLVPAKLAAKLCNSHFLFLGYSLRDWNLRVIFHRILDEQIVNYKSWSIQRNPPRLDEEFWRKREVDSVNAGLKDYVRKLSGLI